MPGMTRRLMLLDASRPTFKSLFEAYQKLNNETLAWIDEIMREAPELEGTDFRAILTKTVSEQIYDLAGCILVVADNIVKTYVMESGLKDYERDNYGLIVANNVKFGRAVHHGANAYRHYSEWNGRKPKPFTAEALDLLGITERDVSVSHRILQLAKVLTEQQIESEIDCVCDEIDKEKTPGFVRGL